MMKTSIRLVIAIVVLIAVIQVNSPLCFAEMPAATVVVGEKAYSLDYVFAVGNESEIMSSLLENGFDFYFKDFSGEWVDSLGNEIDKNELPAVVYKDGIIQCTYSAGDGDEIQQDYIFQIIDIY